jgi:hypothetical protein
MIEEVGSLEIPKASPKWPSSNRGNFGVDLKGVTSRQNPRKKPVVESSSESDGSGNEAEHGVDGGKDSGAVAASGPDPTGVGVLSSPDVVRRKNKRKLKRQAVGSTDESDSGHDSDVIVTDGTSIAANASNGSVSKHDVILAHLMQMFEGTAHSQASMERVAEAAGTVEQATEMMLAMSPASTKSKKEKTHRRKKRAASVESGDGGGSGWMSKATAASDRDGSGGGSTRSKPKAKRMKKESAPKLAVVRRHNDRSSDEGDFGSDSSGDGDSRLVDVVAALKWFNECPHEELSAIKGCSNIKANKIMKLRPFATYEELVDNLDDAKGLNAELVYAYTELITNRRTVGKVLQGCLDVSETIRQADLLKKGGADGGFEPPACFGKGLALKDFQRVGVGWLVEMHQHNLNIVGSDSMRRE